MGEKERRRLGAVLYENFELLGLYGPLEMFGCLPEEIEIVTVAKGLVRSTPGPQTVAQFDYRDCPPLDLIRGRRRNIPAQLNLCIPSVIPYWGPGARWLGRPLTRSRDTTCHG